MTTSSDTWRRLLAADDADHPLRVGRKNYGYVIAARTVYALEARGLVTLRPTCDRCGSGPYLVDLTASGRATARRLQNEGASD